jgi:hypothetical protein
MTIAGSAQYGGRARWKALPSSTAVRRVIVLSALLAYSRGLVREALAIAGWIVAASWPSSSRRRSNR